MRIKELVRAIWRSILSERARRRVHATLWRIESIWAPARGLEALRLYRQYRKELTNYQLLPGVGEIDPVDLWPCLFDKTTVSPIPAHYFYQAAWAARQIVAHRPKIHIDIGSQIELVGILSASLRVAYVDIRPLVVSLSNVDSIAGSILSLPFASGGIESLSCLHVIEHIGLGRYGDPVDPRGTEKAAKELSRVLAVNGNLFLSIPVGRERTCFNAHRVHSPESILRFFDSLTLVQFACEDDRGNYRENVDPMDVRNASYACGMFWFSKR